MAKPRQTLGRWVQLDSNVGANITFAATADQAQAAYYRGFLEQEKSELEVLLAAQTRRLTVCMTEGEMTPISHVRCASRATEGQLGVIDRMPKAILRRFPDEEDLRRRA